MNFVLKSQKGLKVLTGTIINAAAIIMMGLLGTLMGRGIPEKINHSVMLGLGLLVAAVGIQYTFGAENVAVVALSLGIGIILGEVLDLDGKINRFGAWVQHRLTKNSQSSLGAAFVTASLLFCVGAMGILGSIEDGLTGNYQILLLKSVLDAIFSLILGASMGIGVVLSAVPILLYQGGISLAASSIQAFLSDALMSNITALGGVMIAAIGLNMMKVTEIKVSNMLPGLLLVAPLMYLYSLIPVV